MNIRLVHQGFTESNERLDSYIASEALKLKTEQKKNSPNYLNSVRRLLDKMPVRDNRLRAIIDNDEELALLLENQSFFFGAWYSS